MRRSMILATAVFLAAAPLSAQAGKARAVRNPPAAGIPSSFQFMGWAPVGQARKLTNRALVGYLGPGAPIALQYGVKDLAVHRFRPAIRTKKTAGREITLEVFRMGTAADAYGLFSVGRRITDRASAAISAPNVIGRDRAALVIGYAYVKILTKRCEETEVERIAAAVMTRIRLPADVLPPCIARLPKGNLVPGTERYIRGSLAAGAESPLLARDFWGFRSDTVRACAARYAPGDSKLIVVEFDAEPSGLSASVLALFKEFLEDVREENSLVIGADSAGAVSLFGLAGKIAVLIISEPDAGIARARLSEALAGAK